MSKLVLDLYPFFKVYEDGHVDRLLGSTIVPPSLDDPETHVQSKDVVYCPQSNLSSRLYLPKSTPPNQKLPLLVYFHGGGFCIETAFSPTYHNYLNKLVSEANIAVVSVDYRRAPEHPLPAAYDDSWTALKWVASHSNGDGPEEWLNLHANLDHVFLAGDSAGANIAHFIGMRFGKEKLGGINVFGIVLIHPYFGGKEAIGDEGKILEMKSKFDALWLFTYPGVSGLDDPVINPGFDSNLSKLGCRKLLVIVAEKDMLKFRGWDYYEKVKESGWDGCVEIMEAKEEEHVFHLIKPSCDNAVEMMKKMVDFLNQAN
ncbi:probable carboxylesterase 12 [Euphorbia lathyris]|uniref:probable carboxylesterase 12 n=1 Tax=Euphorbia lathyris TaxID=212925 RepID=UPI0033133CAF